MKMKPRFCALASPKEMKAQPLCANKFGARRRCLGLILLAASAALFTGCGDEKKAEAAPADVEVVQVVQKDVPITRQWVATLTGFVNAQIRAQVSGYLLKQNYTNGAYVKKGAPLFQLDPRTFQATVDQAKGNLAQATADLEKANAQLGKTQLDVARYTPLAKQGAVSQQELDDATQANLAALGQVAAAKAAIEAAKAAVESAQLNLGFATVTAPIDGIAGIANAQVGDFVGPQTTNALTMISTINPILVNFNPSEQDYLKAMREAEKLGETDVQAMNKLSWILELTDGTTYPLKGKFYALDRQVNVTTGSILVQVQFPNPANLLRPGGFGNISAVTTLLKGALIVPQRAVTDVQGKYLVAVVEPGNKVSIKPVTVGSKIGTMWVITDGLKPGDQVVAEGTQKVQNGSHINPTPYKAVVPETQNSTKSGAS
jgi:membrane fusion protein (multidrug efflux system)